MFRLLDLPDEIISNHLVPVLGPSDIKSLFLTCRQLYLVMNQQIVWHTLFIKTFGDVPVPYETIHKWPKLFRLRNRSNLYAWGETAGGRLGVPIGEIKKSLIIRSNSTELGHRVYAANVPVLMERFKGKTAVDIAGAGFFFSILTESGEIYNTGIGGTSRPDVRSFGFPEDERMRHTGEHARQNVEVLSKMITHPEGTHFIAISAGRNHTLALDNKNSLWVWDCRRQQLRGIRMVSKSGYLSGLNNSIPSSYLDNMNIEKIRSGWNYNSCLISGIGILVWFNRSGYNDDYEAEFGDKAFIVPNTGGVSSDNDLSKHVVDYAALDGCLILVNALGKAYKVDFDGHQIADIYSLSGFQNSLKRQWRDAKFVRVNGSYKSFALMSNADDVFLGETDMKERSSPKILKELQHKGCISIVFGDYHKLALFKNGELYSWGRDSQMCGCTCLGALSPEELRTVSQISGHDRIIPNPVKVPIKGMVLAISAGGWQSAALITDSEH